MKRISDYTTYCTEEQTRNAIKLGAPIEKDTSVIAHGRPVIAITKGWSSTYYFKPTAEQMIAWLEEQDCISSILVDKDQYERYMYVLRGDKRKIINDAYGFSSRKEATIAAIDAALNYLTTNNYDN